jgi:membrane associated rhomboid family serine protease
MIPIRDAIPSKNVPIVNVTLIAINVLIYLIELANYPEFNRIMFIYGLVPARYTVPEIAAHFDTVQQIFALFSFMFLHGGFWHILGNMWFLYIFGDNVEDRLGHLRYLAFYLLCGWASGLTHLIFNWHSQIPTIGASGAIAGVMGAYLLLHPRSRVLTMIPIIIIPYFVEIPAAFFIGIWFFFQFLSAALSDAQATGIAWWAHIGGFISGIVFLKLFLMIPEFGLTASLRHTTKRRKTPRLQVIKPVQNIDEYNMHGTIAITPREALKGTRKIISVPRGSKKKTFVVTIPPGIKEGTTLKLGGIGKKIDEYRSGDVFLKVMIQPEEG